MLLLLFSAWRVSQIYDIHSFASFYKEEFAVVAIICPLSFHRLVFDLTLTSKSFGVKLLAIMGSNPRSYSNQNLFFSFFPLRNVFECNTPLLKNLHQYDFGQILQK